MHCYALAIIPRDGDVDELITEALAPFDQKRKVELYTEDGETYWRNPQGMWDWWQLGGRWTGILSGYDPNNDPALQESCWVCSGTGRRDDELGRRQRATDPGYTCNGCDGTGSRPLWPTSWPRLAEDIVDVENLDLAALTAAQLPYTIFTHGSESVTSREVWTGSEFRTVHDEEGIRSVLATILAARIRTGLKDRVVVVDYHL